MAKKVWVHYENGVLVTSGRERPPKNTVSEAPKANGRYIADISLLKLVDVVDKETGEKMGKKAVIDREKFDAMKEARRRELEQQANRDRRRAERKKRLRNALADFNNLSTKQKDDLLKDLIKEALGG